MANKYKYCKLVIAAAAILLAIFDIGSDWYAFSDFFRFRENEYDTNLTIALGVLCGVTSILFIVELRNAIVTFRVYDESKNSVLITDSSDAERSLERWQEVTSFLQMVLEDLPISIILYITFRSGSCTLFTRLFSDSFTGNLALVAAFASSLFKVLVALAYCVCGGYQGMDNCGWKCCCCCQRTFRAMLALLLVGFTAYLFFTFNALGMSVRSECMDNAPNVTDQSL